MDSGKPGAERTLRELADVVVEAAAFRRGAHEATIPEAAQACPLAADGGGDLPEGTMQRGYLESAQSNYSKLRKGFGPLFGRALRATWRTPGVLVLRVGHPLLVLVAGFLVFGRRHLPPDDAVPWAGAVGDAPSFALFTRAVNATCAWLVALLASVVAAQGARPRPRRLPDSARTSRIRAPPRRAPMR